MRFGRFFFFFPGVEERRLWMTDTPFFLFFTKYFFTNVLFLAEIGEVKERETFISNWCWLPVASGSLLPLQTGTSKLPIPFTSMLSVLCSLFFKPCTSRVKRYCSFSKYVHLFQLLEDTSGMHKGTYSEGKRDNRNISPFVMWILIFKFETIP